MKPIKNKIHRTLIEIKENKKKTILENKIIKNRFKIILEDKNLRKNKDKFFSQLNSEIVYLNKQGYNPKLVKEGLSDIFTSLFGDSSDSIFHNWRDSGVNWLINQLGFDNESKISNLIRMSFSNIPVKDIPEVITNCELVTKIVAKSMHQSYLQELQEDFGVKSLSGEVMKNLITDNIHNDEFLSRLEGGLSNIICPLLGRVSANMAKQEDNIKSKLFAPSYGA
jgi:hypothetical protein